MITGLLSFVLALPSAAAPSSSCTRAHDREIEIVLPAAVHARLFTLRGPHARRAAAFLLQHSTHTLTIAVPASVAARYPELPFMADDSVMQFMSGKGYFLAHALLHELPGGETGLAQRPAEMAALADMLLPIWVHEISHGRVHERLVRWPVAATLEDELIACYTQAVFTAELLAAEPGYAGLRAAYRAKRATLGGNSAALRRYRALPPTKRLILQTLEVGAASTEEFERMYRRAYDMKASLADPLTAGLRHHTAREELARLLEDFKLPPSPRKTSAEELIAYGRGDDAFWLDPAAAPAAKKDAEGELAALRRELDAARPALRAWFVAAAGKPVDWAKLVPPRDVPIGIAPPEEANE